MTIDGAGTLFIADSFNSAIRKIPLQPSASFTVSSLDAVSSTTTGVAATMSTGFASVVGYSDSEPSVAFEIIDVHTNNTLVSEASIVATPAIRSGRIQAEINGNTNTGLALANPNDQVAEVAFYFSDANGDFNRGTLNVPANGAYIRVSFGEDVQQQRTDKRKLHVRFVDSGSRHRTANIFERTTRVFDHHASCCQS